MRRQDAVADAAGAHRGRAQAAPASMRRQDAVADAAAAHRGRAQDGPDSIRLAFITISAYGAPQESARQSLSSSAQAGEDGGKSGLQRARCQVTPGGREPTESA